MSFNGILKAFPILCITLPGFGQYQKNGYVITYEGDSLNAKIELSYSLKFSHLYNSDNTPVKSIKGIFENGGKFKYEAGIIPKFVLEKDVYLCIGEGDKTFLPKKYVKGKKYYFLKVWQSGFYTVMYQMHIENVNNNFNQFNQVNNLSQQKRVYQYTLINPIGDLIITSNAEKTLSVLFQDDSVVMQMLKSKVKRDASNLIASTISGVTYETMPPDRVIDLFYRYNYHKSTGKLLKDEVNITFENWEGENVYYENDSAIKDVIPSTLQTKVWDNELIILRRSEYSKCRDLLSFGQTVLLSHKYLEAGLKELQKMHEESQFNSITMDQIEKLNKHLENLILTVPSLKVKFYRDELDFYLRQIKK